jgi:hypothetical protein
MTGRWKRKQIKDNDGKNLTIHHYGDYEICLNINRGLQAPGTRDKHGNHWQFEVVYNEKYVGEAPTLAGAKKLAAAHAKENRDV